MRQRIFILSILLLLTVASNLYSQRRRDKKTRAEFPVELREMIEKKDYKLVAEMVHPNFGRSIPLLDDRYSLEVKGDSIISMLPYYGRAYNLPYGGGEGLFFKTTITEYNYREGRNNSVIVSINAKTDEDYYSFIITFYPDGGPHLSVSSNNRQGVSFSTVIVKNSESKDVE